jgi:hypothetical protein
MQMDDVGSPLAHERSDLTGRAELGEWRATGPRECPEPDGVVDVGTQGRRSLGPDAVRDQHVVARGGAALGEVDDHPHQTAAERFGEVENSHGRGFYRIRIFRRSGSDSLPKRSLARTVRV